MLGESMQEAWGNVNPTKLYQPVVQRTRPRHPQDALPWDANRTLYMLLVWLTAGSMSNMMFSYFIPQHLVLRKSGVIDGAMAARVMFWGCLPGVVAKVAETLHQGSPVDRLDGLYENFVSWGVSYLDEMGDRVTITTNRMFAEQPAAWRQDADAGYHLHAPQLGRGRIVEWGESRRRVAEPVHLANGCAVRVEASVLLRRVLGDICEHAA
jgi:hypothetical protein